MWKTNSKGYRRAQILVAKASGELAHSSAAEHSECSNTIYANYRALAHIALLLQITATAANHPCSNPLELLRAFWENLTASSFSSFLSYPSQVCCLNLHSYHHAAVRPDSIRTEASCGQQHVMMFGTGLQMAFHKCAFAGAAAVKYGSLLLDTPFQPKLAVGLSIVAAPCTAFAIYLGSKSR